MKKRFNKRGISPVIATVLLLVLTFVTVSVIAVFVVPLVRDSLDGSQDCLDILGQVTFEETLYNCYAEGPIGGGSSGERTGFSVRANGDEVVGLKIGIFGGGQSDVVEIFSDTNGNDLVIPLRMLNENFGETLKIPSRGGVRTYVANGTYNKIEVSAVLASGKTCEVSDDIEVGRCVDNTANSGLLAY